VQLTHPMRASMRYPWPDAFPVHVGEHLVEQRGEDALILRGSGEISPEEARLLIAMDREQARRNGYSLVIIDATRISGIDAAARHAMFDEMKQHTGYLGSTAVFGLKGPLIWLMGLIMRGVALLGRHFDDEFHVCANEDEAWSFLRKRRALRQRQANERARKT
jgi:hypothetical protein